MTIKAKGIVYKIESSNYENYLSLKEKITSNRTKLENGQKKYEYYKNKRESIILIMVGFLLLVLTVYIYISQMK